MADQGVVRAGDQGRRDLELMLAGGAGGVVHGGQAVHRPA